MLPCRQSRRRSPVPSDTNNGESRIMLGEPELLQSVRTLRHRQYALPLEHRTSATIETKRSSQRAAVDNDPIEELQDLTS